MAVKVSELNHDDIYMRSYPKGKTGKCKYIGKGRWKDKILYRFRFLDDDSTITTNKEILETRNIYHRIKNMSEKIWNNPKKAKSW